jgi:hypothetical protein
LSSSDPLYAVERLLAAIEGSSAENGNINELSSALDLFMFAHWALFSDDICPIETSDREPPQSNYQAEYAALGRRFPQLGFYRTAASLLIKSTEDALETAVGDAIDDLSDIAAALREVCWFEEHESRREALAALRFRYESHLWMHILPLRMYLEELKRNG